MRTSILLSIIVSTALFFWSDAFGQHPFNGSYKGQNLSRIAFPIGGIGAGMFLVEGNGNISGLSINHTPDLSSEPVLFGAIALKGQPGKARVLEGPVPDWKKGGSPESGVGAPGKDWGLPRFRKATFISRFPFADIDLNDTAVPLAVHVKAWSPFIPGDEDMSSLPVGSIEYEFTNTGNQAQEYVFSFHAQQFMDSIQAFPGGFQLCRSCSSDTDGRKTNFAVFVDQEPDAITDYGWFRGGWYDPLTMLWKKIQHADVSAKALESNASGASLFVPFTLRPGGHKTIRLLFAWYVPHSHLRIGQWPYPDPKEPKLAPGYRAEDYYSPWYSSHFKDVEAVAAFWKLQYDSLRAATRKFTRAFYKSTLPVEVLEAVAANLSILKSPTVLRQYDGRFWGWEGCNLNSGSCPGSCTHVWNYAQALCHLFPRLERSMRNTELHENQDSVGHQSFRAALPIRKTNPIFYAAADGQLGGIIKVYRDWRISADSNWLRQLYPKMKKSLDYCIQAWDPKHTGLLAEPHHNTYDIEFWGAEPMCTGIYLEALEAMTRIGRYLHEPVGNYETLLQKGKTGMEQQLFNGDYFYQHTQWKGLQAGDPLALAKKSFFLDYSEDALKIYAQEGPKYQYGTGCLSDGVIGFWMGAVSGLPSVIDPQKIKSHLASVYRYNFKRDLTGHSNPQRSTYALGDEGGLLLCTWPKGGMPSLPFIYSNEVWTGIEYQVASHLIMQGMVKEGLELVHTTRKRYDGSVRNPFDEYECGHWYARAMSSYALIQALTGVRYDAVEKTLYVDSKVGDFVSFLSTETGFGNVIYHKGKATIKVALGTIDVQHIVVRKKDSSHPDHLH
jgi:uncharacterized protein (DUF608 family)